MAEQLLYGGDRKTVDVDVSMPKSDDRELPFKHVLGPSTAVKEARLHIVDEDDTVVVSLNMADHSTQWDFTTDNEGIIWIKSANTAGLTDTEYSYGIELIDQNDLVYTPQRGKFALSDDVVLNTGTAPHLSWNTREDLDDDIDALEEDISQMASCGDFSYLTVALSGGENSMTVQNGGIFSGTPNIRVMVDGGTYEDETVTGVVGNVVSISGTVSAASAVGNMVRIR